MNFGLSNSDYQLLRQIVLDPLKEKSAKVYIFGSRVTGRHHPFSDIDVLYELSDGALLPAGFIAQIKDLAENSKMTCKLDLVNAQDLAESYKASVFKNRVEV